MKGHYILNFQMNVRFPEEKNENRSLNEEKIKQILLRIKESVSLLNHDKKSIQKQKFG